MKVLSVQDHSMAIFKPPMLALFTNVGIESPWGITWQVDFVFSPNELLVDVLTCTKFMADAQGSVTVTSVYGMPQVLMPAVSPRQGGAVCPSAATGTGIRAKSAGLPGVRVTWAVAMASILFFRSLQRPLGMRRVRPRILYDSGNVNGIYPPHLPFLRPE